MAFPSREQAENLASKYLKDTKRHCEQVAKIMQYFAKKLHQNEEEWYVTWLLHDVDRDFVWKVWEKHLAEDFETIMDEIDAPRMLRDNIISHWSTIPFIKNNQPVDSLIRKYLISIDELSWLIFAYSLMRPTWFEWMEVKSIKKKLKDKWFAAWVSREECVNCEKFLNIPVDEFIWEVIQALS